MVLCKMQTFAWRLKTVQLSKIVTANFGRRNLYFSSFFVSVSFCFSLSLSPTIYLIYLFIYLPLYLFALDACIFSERKKPV